MGEVALNIWYTIMTAVIITGSDELELGERGLERRHLP
jgi:hypothetical protein